jgi:uncharacterized membrane protein (DUF106 family)
MLQVNELITISGAVFTVITFIVGAFSRDRAMQRQYSEDRERFNIAIATIREEFVKKEELKEHIKRLEQTQERILNKLDDLLKQRA